jgi:8-oxo-dGTP diphosphatase
MSETAAPAHAKIVTVDVVLLTVVDDALCVGLVRRDNEPFAGSDALIGGYVRDEDRDTTATATRVLEQKAGLDGFFIEQLATFSGRSRDPRGWSVSVAYLALTPLDRLLKAMGVPPRITLHPIATLAPLPFDHSYIVAAAVERLRSKGAYSTLPARLLPETFTLSELMATYQVALGAPRIDKSSFRRKLMELGLVKPVDGYRETGGRQAQLYQLTLPISVFDRRI